MPAVDTDPGSLKSTVNMAMNSNPVAIATRLFTIGAHIIGPKLPRALSTCPSIA